MTQLKTSTLLIKARKIIEKEKNWTQGAFARDANNERTSISMGCKFCSTGATGKLVQQMGTRYSLFELDTMLDKAVYKLTNCVGMQASDYNDTHTHAEVMHMWDVAIELAIQDEKDEALV